MKNKLIFFLVFLSFYSIGSLLIIRGGNNELIDSLANFTLGIIGLEPSDNNDIKAPIFFSYFVIFYTLVVVVFFRDIIYHEFVYDSPYFMGFLFTLTALCITFYNVGAESTGNPVVVISQSGISLVTSIFGMIGRLFVIALIYEDMSNLREDARKQYILSRFLGSAYKSGSDFVKDAAMRWGFFDAVDEKILKDIYKEVKNDKNNLLDDNIDWNIGLNKLKYDGEIHAERKSQYITQPSVNIFDTNHKKHPEWKIGVGQTALDKIDYNLKNSINPKFARDE